MRDPIRSISDAVMEFEKWSGRLNSSLKFERNKRRFNGLKAQPQLSPGQSECEYYEHERRPGLVLCARRRSSDTREFHRHDAETEIQSLVHLNQPSQASVENPGFYRQRFDVKIGVRHSRLTSVNPLDSVAS